MTDAYLGIDLGGTNIAAAVVFRDGKTKGRVVLPTKKDVSAERIADDMARAARESLANAGLSVPRIKSVGVSAPGAVNPETGVVEYWSNLNFNQVPLAGMLEKRLGTAVQIENDANCAAWGEYLAGAGAGSASLAVMTLGTGVGGGIIEGGRIRAGFNHAGGEIGHMTIVYGGRLCTCGRRGCLETYASATALIRMAETIEARGESPFLSACRNGDLARLEAKHVFDAASAGDGAAREVLAEYLGYVACGVVNIVNLYQPERVCLGGGISGAGAALLSPVQKILDLEDYARNQTRRTHLCLASLGGDAGLIGAALLSEKP